MSLPSEDLMSPHQPFHLVVPVDRTDHVLGPQGAPVTLVEYGDFECPNCKQAAPTVQLLLERFEGRLRFAFRHFPLEEVHPHALAAAEAAEAAGAQDQFWQMHQLLFDNQSHLKPASLHSYAQRLGLDMARYTAEMDDHVYLQRVREHIEGAHRSGVHSTPTFFINGTVHDVSFGLRSLFDAVQKLLDSPA
jgi:protein-disulfide isomerase